MVIESSRPACATGSYRDGREDRSGTRDDLPCEQGHGYALGFGFDLSLIVERNTLGSFASLIHPSVWKVDSPNFRFTEFSEVGDQL